MEILERNLCSKNNDLNSCEDGIFVSDDYIAVIDGATSKGDIKWSGGTSGYIAKEILLRGLEKLPKNCLAVEAFKLLNRELKEAYKNNYTIALNTPKERLQASIVIFSKAQNQIWSLGDCRYIINDVVYDNQKKIDILLSEARSVFLQTEILKGKKIDELLKNDTGRNFILPMLERQGIFINSDSEYNYSVLDGFDFDIDNIIVEDIERNSNIVLASDGYPVLKNTLEKSEKMLSEILRDDPLCIDIYKSTKGLKAGNISFDDRAYIRFSVISDVRL